MPSQQGLGSDDGGDFPKDTTAKHLGLGRPAAALIVVQAESFAPQLLPQYPILLAKVIDRVSLLLTQPSRDRNQQESEGIEGPAHGAIIAAKTAVTGPATCRI
jgi:hypothetical protein